MRGQSIRLLWPVNELGADETAKNALIADPIFRSSLAIAALALSIVAAAAFLKLAKLEPRLARKLNLASAVSAGVAVVSIFVGILASH